MEIREIMLAMDAAAQAVATDKPNGWPGWVCYLLEALDGKATEEEYRAALEAVKRDIDTRLTEGRW